MIKTEREKLIKKEGIDLEIREKVNDNNKGEQMELTVIEQREVLGKDFRIYGDVKNPLFLAKDVAEWVEHNNASEMIKNIDEDEKVKHDSIEFAERSGGRGFWLLTEDGLYEVLMQSRKPIAKQT